MIKIGNQRYELVQNEKSSFNQEEFEDKYTDYFAAYDYIFGDYAYDKLRLKGFYESNHEKAQEFNDISTLDEYILHYCAYQAKYFLLKKVK